MNFFKFFVEPTQKCLYRGRRNVIDQNGYLSGWKDYLFNLVLILFTNRLLQ